MAAACGASSVSDFSAGAPQLAAAPVPAPAANAAGPSAQASASGQTALQKVAQTYMAMADPKSRAYKIGPLDVLEVTVFKVPELSKTVQVSEAGTINFPLLGEVEASGKSAREIEQLLTKELGAKYLQKPQISVFVKEHNSQRVTVEGAVARPGVVPMAGGMSLLQAIAISGGTSEVSENTALVFRVTEGKRFAAKYDISDIRAGKADDPQLQSGDVIIVPTSDLKVGLNTVLRLAPLATLVPLL
ncbi:MAG: polysaccharide biosynthesis/export family protein [Rhodomicrobium sp.]